MPIEVTPSMMASPIMQLNQCRAYGENARYSQPNQLLHGKTWLLQSDTSLRAKRILHVTP